MENIWVKKPKAKEIITNWKSKVERLDAGKKIWNFGWEWRSQTKLDSASNLEAQLN